MVLEPGEELFFPSAGPGPGGCVVLGAQSQARMTREGELWGLEEASLHLSPSLTQRGAFPRNIPQVTTRQAFCLMDVPGAGEQPAPPLPRSGGLTSHRV